MAAAATYARQGKFYVEILQNFARQDVSSATLDVRLGISTPSWVADFLSRFDCVLHGRREMIARLNDASASPTDTGKVLTFRKLRLDGEADPRSINVSLYRAASGRICGWYIGPLTYAGGSISMPYLARSKDTLASIAVIRAVEAAEAIGADVCLIDPDDLWTPAWHA